MHKFVGVLDNPLLSTMQKTCHGRTLPLDQRSATKKQQTIAPYFRETYYYLTLSCQVTIKLPQKNS